jgi:hypothetical protein
MEEYEELIMRKNLVLIVDHETELGLDHGNELVMMETNLVRFGVYQICVSFDIPDSESGIPNNRIGILIYEYHDTPSSRSVHQPITSSRCRSRIV